jgi:hypothetical protein
MRRDDAHALVTAADRAPADASPAPPSAAAPSGPPEPPRRGRRRTETRGPLLVLACILRDQVQTYLAEAAHHAEPLYTMSEAELVARVAAAHGNDAGIALSRVYRRLRALPSRSQAAAPWSSGTLPRRDFESLYRDVAELCRTLGHELREA